MDNHITYPAKFQLVAAMNPCKCGYLGDSRKECNRAPVCAEEYQRKISGPILERIDMHIVVNPSTANIFDIKDDNIESSAVMKKRVEKARDIQEQRFGKRKVNAHMDVQEIECHCVLDNDCQEVMRSAMAKLALSVRQYHKVLRVSRTIADLASSENILKVYLVEALG